ncbi:MAG: hypothetical protein Q9169_000952 [Polycauliona sp. 2 TL-2023]
MRCISAVRLFCFGVIFGLLLAVPRILASTGIARRGFISITPGTQSSEASLAAQPLSPGRPDAQDRPKHDHLSRPPSRLSQRSLAVDLTTAGLRFIFSQFDIIAPSALAYRYTTEFYRNLTTVLKVERRPSSPPQKLVVAYGALKLMAAYAHGRGLTEEILAKVLLSFAEYMLAMLEMFLIGAFQVAVWIVEDIQIIIGMDVDGIGA